MTWKIFIYTIVTRYVTYYTYTVDTVHRNVRTTKSTSIYKHYNHHIYSSAKQIYTRNNRSDYIFNTIITWYRWDTTFGIWSGRNIMVHQVVIRFVKPPTLIALHLFYIYFIFYSYLIWLYVASVGLAWKWEYLLITVSSYENIYILIMGFHENTHSEYHWFKKNNTGNAILFNINVGDIL